MKSEFPGICQKCQSVVIKDFCVKCGTVLNDIKAKDLAIEDKSEIINNNPKAQFSEAHASDAISSLFGNIPRDPLKQEAKSLKKRKKLALHRQTATILLAVTLIGLGVFTYWKYNQSNINFLSPLPTADDENASTSLNTDEKTIDLQINLAEGNFAEYNLAQFADASKNLFIELFGLEDYVQTFISADLVATINKEFKLKDGDIQIYTSDKFALIYPKEQTSTWGLVTAVKNKDFVNEKIKLFDTNKASYEKLSAARKKALPSASLNYDETFVKLTEITNKSDEKETYLLVSNSKEFLDQMKELSEGNIPNLATSAVYAQSQKDLPLVGSVYIYKTAESNAWNEFSIWIASKYNYTGLDKILQKISASVVVMYSKDEKLKIVEQADF